MEPKHNNDYLPAAELPPLDQPYGPGVGPEQRPARPEIRGTPPPVTAGSGAGGTGSSFGTPASASSASSNPAAQPQPTTVPAQTSGLIADDADLIEKEWVLKAKAIVAHTRSDPHQQNIEMTNIKADYLKKRYNKDLKTSGS